MPAKIAANAGMLVLSALLDSPLLDDDDVELVATIASNIAFAPTLPPSPPTPGAPSLDAPAID